MSFCGHDGRMESLGPWLVKFSLVLAVILTVLTMWAWGSPWPVMAIAVILTSSAALGARRDRKTS